jgi:UPF0716 family protein affecting phage T7 exclusion
MKKIANIVSLLLVIFTLSLGFSVSVQAQCSMCTINAEQGSKNGNTQTKGINTGVLYLMGAPFLLVAGVGGVWYLKYRKEEGVNE